MRKAWRPSIPGSKFTGVVHFLLFSLTRIRIVIENRAQRAVSGVKMLNSLKRCAVVLACLLSVCMACSELCEMASLQDDPSNDFTFQVFAGHEQVKAAIAAAKAPREQRREAPEMGRPVSAALAPAMPAPAAASDRQQFSTVLRT